MPTCIMSEVRSLGPSIEGDGSVFFVEHWKKPTVLVLLFFLFPGELVHTCTSATSSTMHDTNFSVLLQVAARSLFMHVCM